MDDSRFAPADVARLVGAAATVAGAAELTDTLEAIVRTGMELTGARYGALGVLGSHGFVTEFIHVGIPPKDVASCINCSGEQAILSTSRRPDSTFDRSRMSFIKVSKCWPLA